MSRKYKNAKKKRGYKKKRQQRAMVSTLGTGISPFPKMFKTRLRYATSIAVNPVATTGSCLLYRANSIYDPEYAAGGHQPRGHDEMFNAYDHCTVIGSKITILLTPRSNSGILAGIYVTDNNTFVLNNEELMERPGAVFKVIANNQSHPTKITRKFSTSKFFSRTRSSLLADDQLRGSLTADANELAYFGVYLNATDGSTDLGQIEYQLIIDYICVFHEPSQISAS